MLMQSNEYWSKRLDKEVKASLLGQERNTVKFLKVYKESLVKIQTYNAELYAKYSVNGVLSLSDMHKFNRYTNMEKQIKSIITDLGKQEKSYMTGELKRVYTESYIKTGTILAENIPSITINFAIIPTGFVEKAISYPWSGTNFSDRIWKNKEKLITNLEQTLTRGFINGDSISTMTKGLKTVMDVGATEARRLVRTEAMHCIGSSHNDSYIKAGIDKVQFITANDSRVCDDCDLINENIYDIADSPMIPQHCNSRSINIPYFED